MRTVHVASLSARNWLTPRTTRLTLTGDVLAELRPRPAQDIEVLLSSDDGSRIERRYTIRHARPELGEWDIDVVVHQHGGPGSRWAAEPALGSRVEFAGPRGKLVLRPARHSLFVGDEASLPAIAASTEALPPGSQATVIVEVASEADRIPVTASDVRWLHRGDGAAGTTDLLSPAVAAHAMTTSIDHAYLMCESRVTKALHELLRQSGVQPTQVFAKGYWNRDDAAASRRRG